MTASDPHNPSSENADHQETETRTQKLRAILEVGKPQAPDIQAPKTDRGIKHAIRSVLAKIFSARDNREE